MSRAPNYIAHLFGDTNQSLAGWSIAIEEEVGTVPETRETVK